MDKKQKSNNKSYQQKKCSFQYAITVASNYEEIGRHAERITKIKTFINKYNSEGIKGINYPSENDDCKTFEKNNVKIALNVLYAKKGKNMHPSYVSNHNSNREKQVIF